MQYEVIIWAPSFDSVLSIVGSRVAAKSLKECEVINIGEHTLLRINVPYFWIRVCKVIQFKKKLIITDWEAIPASRRLSRRLFWEFKNLPFHRYTLQSKNSIFIDHWIQR